MTDVYYWLGDASETTASVIVRSDTAGTLTLTGCTNDGPHAVDPAVDYGIVKFNVTGLSADTSYMFAVHLDSAEVADGALRTMPTSGVTWSFGFGSCVGQNRPQVYGYQLVIDHDIRAWFALGDTPYCDGDLPVNGLGLCRWTVGPARGSTYTTWDTGRVAWDYGYANLQKTPGWEYLTQRVPTYRMPDDHEYGNDWDWTTDNVANFGAPAATITTQAQIDTCGGYANAAAWSWNKGNPANSDPEIGDWAPSSCADAASNHPTKYYRKTIGNVEFFHIDCYAHMDAWAKADKYRTVCIDNATLNAVLGYTYSNPSAAALAKTRLGPYQLNWLLTHLASSTATFKVILSGKHTFMALAQSDNEVWSGYATERDYIIAFIRKYITGCIWLTGDVHTASVINDLSGHCAVNSSTLGQVEWIDGTGSVGYRPGFAENMTWRANGHSGAAGTGLNPNTYGVVDVTDAYIRPKIYKDNGTLLWSAYLKAGKNYLQPSLDEPGEWA